MIASSPSKGAARDLIDQRAVIAAIEAEDVRLTDGDRFVVFLQDHRQAPGRMGQFAGKVHRQQPDDLAPGPRLPLRRIVQRRFGDVAHTIKTLLHGSTPLRNDVS